MKPIAFKPILTFSPREKKVRLCRIVWRPVIGDPAYSRYLAISLRSSLLQLHREYSGWFLTIAGIQLHFKSHPTGTFPA